MIGKIALGVLPLCICSVLVILQARHEHIAIVESGSTVKGSAGQAAPTPQHPFMLHLKDASSLPVRDFLKNTDITTDIRNPGVYYLGNTISENSHAPSPRYIISYEHSIQFFKIVLLQNPLGNVRHEAEAYLKRTLDVDDATLCNLNYRVTTPAEVSQVFSNLDLKFSSCQDSVTLR